MMLTLFRFLLLLALVAAPAARTHAQEAKILKDIGFPARSSVLKDGGFENGLVAPWGTGQYEKNGIWWNSMNCQSKAAADYGNSHGGNIALYLSNRSSRAPNVFGTIVQEIPIQPGRKYRITLWAMGRDLASKGAVNIAVDPEWKVHPLALPAGTFGWQKFEGTFQLPSATAQFRILFEDKGEAWIDDISVTPVPEEQPPAVGISVLTSSPAIVRRGGEAKIDTAYDDPGEKTSIAVTEEWTLLFNGKPVMPPFRMDFELRRGQVRHGFALPIPTQADTGVYTLQMRTIAPGPSVSGQTQFRVSAENPQ